VEQNFLTKKKKKRGKVERNCRGAVTLASNGSEKGEIPKSLNEKKKGGGTQAPRKERRTENIRRSLEQRVKAALHAGKKMQSPLQAGRFGGTVKKSEPMGRFYTGPKMKTAEKGLRGEKKTQKGEGTRKKEGQGAISQETGKTLT